MREGYERPKGAASCSAERTCSHGAAVGLEVQRALRQMPSHFQKICEMKWLGEIGAGEAIRTPDPNLGKVVLYP